MKADIIYQQDCDCRMDEVDIPAITNNQSSKSRRRDDHCGGRCQPSFFTIPKKWFSSFSTFFSAPNWDHWIFGGYVCGMAPNDASTFLNEVDQFHLQVSSRSKDKVLWWDLATEWANLCNHPKLRGVTFIHPNKPMCKSARTSRFFEGSFLQVQRVRHTCK